MQVKDVARKHLEIKTKKWSTEFVGVRQSKAEDGDNKPAVDTARPKLSAGGGAYRGWLERTVCMSKQRGLAVNEI